MDDAQLGAAGDENLASTWATLGRSVGGAVVEDGPLTLVATSIPIAFFNGAYVRAPAGDPERLIEQAVQFFRDRKIPGCSGCATALRPTSSARPNGRAARCRRLPAMGLTPIPRFSPAPAELTIEMATTPESLRDHADMLRDGFEMPQEIVDGLIQPPLLGYPNLAVFVGRVDGTPVSCSLLAVSGTTAGVYNVATPAPFRGRGYGEALTWAPVIEGARRGCTHAVLQSTASGYPVYRRMGFVDLGRYVQLEGPP
jgi:hypothetical protein